MLVCQRVSCIVPGWGSLAQPYTGLQEFWNTWTTDFLDILCLNENMKSLNFLCCFNIMMDKALKLLCIHFILYYNIVYHHNIFNIYIYHRRIYIYIYPIYNVYHHYIYRIICIIQYYMYHHYIFSILYVLALHIQYHMHHHYLLNILYVSWHVYIYVQYIICIIIIYSIYYMCNHYICSIIIWCIIMNFRYKLGTFWNREHCMILTASFRPLRNAMQVCLAGGRNAASPRNVVLPSLSHFKKTT